MKNSLEKIAFDWITAKEEDIDIDSQYFCKTRDNFVARLDSMLIALLKNIAAENLGYIVYAIAGEIGNNSFDHNIGKWPDIMGTFFAFSINAKTGQIILADRGQGVLATLKRVKPELKHDKEALKVAFTEKISGRAPEARGNGLKYVKENVKNESINLEFYSGQAKAILNKEMKIIERSEHINGCLAILKIVL